MPPPTPPTTPKAPTARKLYPAAMVILGEAANQGPEGMAMVRDTLFNRASAKKDHLRTMDDVANEMHFNQQGTPVYQYTAAGRNDLESFWKKQPPMLQNLAQQLVDEVHQQGFQPQYDVKNYVTKDLYDRRFDPAVSDWIRKMEVAGVVGDHVLLREPRKPKR